MSALVGSFFRGLPSLPLILAALYMLSIVSATSAGRIAVSLLKARIVLTLISSVLILVYILVGQY